MLTSGQPSLVRTAYTSTSSAACGWPVLEEAPRRVGRATRLELAPSAQAPGGHTRSQPLARVLGPGAGDTRSQPLARALTPQGTAPTQCPTHQPSAIQSISVSNTKHQQHTHNEVLHEEAAQLDLAALQVAGRVGSDRRGPGARRSRGWVGEGLLANTHAHG